MVSASDSVALPDRVRADGSSLLDDVRGESWPMNAAAAFVLARQGQPLGSVVDELASAYGLPVARARADVLAFVLLLNEQLLLNVVHRGHPVRRWLELARLAIRLAPAGTLPGALARRRRLDTTTAWRAICTTFAAVWPRGLTVAGLVSLLALHILVASGSGALAAGLTAGLGAGLGVGIHEAGHAAALCRVPAAMVLHGRRTYVLHHAVTPRRHVVVALAGPMPVAALGAGLVLLALVAASPLLAVAGLAPAAHALSLTVATGDGRRACGL